MAVMCVKKDVLFLRMKKAGSIDPAFVRQIGIGKAYLDIQRNDAKNFTALLISSSDG